MCCAPTSIQTPTSTAQVCLSGMRLQFPKQCSGNRNLNEQDSTRPPRSVQDDSLDLHLESAHLEFRLGSHSLPIVLGRFAGAGVLPEPAVSAHIVVVWLLQMDCT